MYKKCVNFENQIKQKRQYETNEIPGEEHWHSKLRCFFFTMYHI